MLPSPPVAVYSSGPGAYARAVGDPNWAAYTGPFRVKLTLVFAEVITARVPVPAPESTSRLRSSSRVPPPANPSAYPDALLQVIRPPIGAPKPSPPTSARATRTVPRSSTPESLPVPPLLPAPAAPRTSLPALQAGHSGRSGRTGGVTVSGGA